MRGNALSRLTLLLCALLAFASCNHKELCYTHPHKARIRLDVDWSLFRVETPTGMSVLFYPEEGGAPQTVLSNTTTHVETDLAIGTYRALVYNQSPSEFGSVTFSGMDALETAAVYADTHTSRWYTARADDERIIAEPEWIGTCTSGTLDVTRPMVDATTEARNRSRQAPAPETNVLGTLVPQNIIYTITVNIHLRGIYNLRSARASLDGLAAGYEFGSGKPSAAKGTQLLESWTVTTDPDDPTRGVLTSRIQSFGLPEGHKGEAGENTLGVSLLLVDNKTQLDYTFKVGDSFVRGTDVEITLSIDKTIEEPLPDVKPEGGSSGGFNATVDDWGDEVDIDIDV